MNEVAFPLLFNDDTRGVVLIVDNDPQLAGLLRDAFIHEGLNASTVADPNQARERLHGTPRVDVVLSDVRMEISSGMALLDQVALLPHGIRPRVVMLSGSASRREVAESMRKGAVDYLDKGDSPERIVRTVQQIVAQVRLEHERDDARSLLGLGSWLLGESHAARTLRRAIVHVSQLDVPVLLTGEQGSGVEWVARAIHTLSSRTGPLVMESGASLVDAQRVETLLYRTTMRRPEGPDAGSLLIDEPGDMSPEAQRTFVAHLTTPRAGIARVMASATRDLSTAARVGHLSRDLAATLRVIQLAVPTLRDRIADLAALITATARELLGPTTEIEIAASTMQQLERYDWPGNIRQLRRWIEQVCTLSSGTRMLIDDDTLVLLGEEKRDSLLPSSTYRHLVEAFERDLIRAELSRTNGNIAAAARNLGVDRGNFYRRLSALGLHSEK